MRHRLPILLALVSAGLYTAALSLLAPSVLLPLVFFVPVLVGIRMARAAWQPVAVYALVFAAVMLFGVQTYGRLYYLASVLVVAALHALPMLGYVWLARHARGELWLALSFAALYTLFDYLCSLQFAVPIGRIGATVASDPAWAWLAAYVGPYGLGFLVTLANALAAAAVWSAVRHRAEDVKRPAGVFVLLAAGWALGAWVAPSAKEVPSAKEAPSAMPISVAVVQGALTRDEYLNGSNDKAAEQNILQRYLVPTKRALTEHDLVIWPETALWRYRAVQRALDDLLVDTEATLVGGFPVRIGISARSEVFNAVLSLEGSSVPQGVYAKNHLVPFQESTFSPGPRATLLHTSLGELATPVCFEATFTRYVETLLQHNPAALIVVSNDAGFGISPISYYMAKQALLAAVSYGKPLVRAGQAGISLIAGSDGTIEARTGLFERTVLVGRITPDQSATFYARQPRPVRQYAVPSAALLTLVLWWVLGRAAKRNGQ